MVIKLNEIYVDEQMIETLVTFFSSVRYRNNKKVIKGIGIIIISSGFAVTTQVDI